jgi:hypothetical protein
MPSYEQRGKVEDKKPRDYLPALSLIGDLFE